MANDLPSQRELEPRQPTLEDLRDLCRELNARGAHYLVVGGFAIGNATNRTWRQWFMPQLPQILAWIDQGVRVLEIR